MNDEYIRKSDAVQAINPPEPYPYIYGERTLFAAVKRRITNIPAADVQPVKRGKWVESDYKYNSDFNCFIISAKCSACDHWCYVIATDKNNMSRKYCDYCGARMDGEKNG